MDRNPDARSREMRQLMILALLRRYLPGRVPPRVIKDDLYSNYPGLTEEAVHRRFSADMDGLRTSGVIAYDDLRASRRVTLKVPQKDPAFHLTTEEHRALAEARQRLDWKPVPSPFAWQAGTRKLAYVVRALRLIEEDTTEVTDLAEALDVRPRKVRQILDRLDGIRPASEVLAELAIERGDGHRRAQAAHVRLGPAERPLSGRGLDEIGLFAYSREEVDDRIGLIDAALQAGAPDRDVRALRSARAKLVSWRARLERS